MRGLRRGGRGMRRGEMPFPAPGAGLRPGGIAALVAAERAHPPAVPAIVHTALTRFPAGAGAGTGGGGDSGEGRGGAALLAARLGADLRVFAGAGAAEGGDGEGRHFAAIATILHCNVGGLRLGGHSPRFWLSFEGCGGPEGPPYIECERSLPIDCRGVLNLSAYGGAPPSCFYHPSRDAAAVNPALDGVGRHKGRPYIDCERSLPIDSRGAIYRARSTAALRSPSHAEA